MVPSLFRDMTPVQIIRIKWRLVVDAIVDAMTDGSVPNSELRWVEDKLCDFAALAVWNEHRLRVLANDPDGERDENKKLLRLPVRDTELWNRLLEQGFVESVRSAPEGWHAKIIRVIGAILLDPAKLADFVGTACGMEPRPAWVQAALAKRRRDIENRPVEPEQPDGPGLAGGST